MSDRAHAPESPRVPLFAACAVYLLFACGILALGGVDKCILRLFPDIAPFAFLLLRMGLFYGLVAFLPSWWLVRRTDAWDTVRISPVNGFEMVLAAMQALIGLWLMNNLQVLWNLVLHLAGWVLSEQSTLMPADTGEVMLGVFAYAVIPAVCEEFMMRGVIFSAWEKHGTHRAVWVSALLFALLHGSVEGFPVQFLQGLVLGVIVWTTGSVYPAVVYHTVINAVTFILNSYYAVPMGSEEALLYQTDMVAYLGGTSGVISLVFETAVYAILFFIMLRGFWKRAKMRKIEPFPKTKMRLSLLELAVLALALMPIGVLYGISIFRTIGGGA